MILGNRQMHEFTHSILKLSATAESLGETLPQLPFSIVQLTDFAAEFRHKTPRSLPPAEPGQIRQAIRILREHVHAGLLVLNA